MYRPNYAFDSSITARRGASRFRWADCGFPRCCFIGIGLPLVRHQVRSDN